MADNEKTTIAVERQNAIAAAVKEADKQVQEDVGDKTAQADNTEKLPDSKDDKSGKPEGTSGGKKEDAGKKVDGTDNPEPATSDEEKILIQQGRELMLALRDPSKAGIVIDFLATQAGYKKEAAAPKNEEQVKEVADEIEEFLKVSLGDEFSIIADKLKGFGKAIEKVLDKRLEKANEDIRTKFQQQEQERLRSQSTNALISVTEDFFGKDEPVPDKVTDEMSRLMDRYPPSSDITPKEYIKDIFDMAVGRLGLTKSDKAKQERTNKNRTDAGSRLASERVPADSHIRRDDSKPLSRREAIQMAVEAASKEG